jgi:hypothetical protein
MIYAYKRTELCLIAAMFIAIKEATSIIAQAANNTNAATS